MVNASKPVLLIDVDGVVVTTTPHWSTDLERDFGFDKAALRAHFFAPFWADIVTGHDDLLPRLAQALNTMKSNVKASDLRDYWFRRDADLNLAMLDWIADRRQAGHRVMLATNQDHSRATYLMENLGLSAHCDGIYHSASLGAAKPNPLFFHKIYTAEQRAVRDLILIDDTMENVRAARVEGWRAHHFTGVAQLTTAMVSGDCGSVNPSTTLK